MRQCWTNSWLNCAHSTTEHVQQAFLYLWSSVLSATTWYSCAAFVWCGHFCQHIIQFTGTIQVLKYHSPSLCINTTLFSLAYVHVIVHVMLLLVPTRGGVASRKHRPNNVEMKPPCGLSLEHNPQVGFGWQQGGGGWRGTQAQILICGPHIGEAAAFWASHSNLCVFVWVCVCICVRLAWPGICPLLSSPRVWVGALCERLPVRGQSILWRGRGQRHSPSQQPPPSQHPQGAYQNVRGG